MGRSYFFLIYALSRTVLVRGQGNGCGSGAIYGTPSGYNENFYGNCPGNDIGYQGGIGSAAGCAANCDANSNCCYFAYDGWDCFQKHICFTSDTYCGASGGGYSMYQKNPITCANVFDTSIGSVSPGAPYTSVNAYTYTCNAGYNIGPTPNVNGATSQTITCLCSGAWSAAIVPCVPQTCSSEFGTANGAIDQAGPYYVSNAYTYTCDAGYGVGPPNGPLTQVYTCQSSATWNIPFTACQQLQCSNQFGSVEGAIGQPAPYLSGNSYTYTCDAGWGVGPPNGPLTKVYTCSLTATWSSPFIACQQLQCSNQFGTVQGAPNTTAPYLSGNTYTYTCNPGWGVGPPNGNSSMDYACSLTATWSSPFIACQQLQCSNQFNLTQGTVSANAPFLSGNIYTFTCNAGTGVGPPNGPSSMSYTCMLSGNWDKAFIPCQQLQCADQFSTTDGTIVPAPYLSNTSYTYTCDVDYGVGPPDGAASQTYFCSLTAAWNSPFVGCERLQCWSQFDNSGNISAGSPPWYAGDNYTFTCPPNWTTRLDEAVVLYSCSSNAQWSPMFRPCVSTCAQKWPQMNGYITMSQNVSVRLSGRAYAGSTAFITCNRGYALVGQTSSLCLEDGQWSDEFPVCVAITTTPTTPAATEPPACSSWLACWWWVWLLITWATIATALLVGWYVLTKCWHFYKPLIDDAGTQTMTPA